MKSSLIAYIENLNIQEISSSRLDFLQIVIDNLRLKLDSKEPLNLTFICTHNSRRSHFCQVWAQTMASYYGIHRTNSFSAGTEATAIYSSVTEALIQCGFDVFKLTNTENPILGIRYSSKEKALLAFSKKIDHSWNPSTHFFAIMTCTDADKNCPVVHGAISRLSLPYLDPKQYDNTGIEGEKYVEKCREIATEMKYIFSQLKF